MNRILYRGPQEEYLIVRNVKKLKNGKIGHNYSLNEKHQVGLAHYSVHPWGKVEMMFVEMKNTDDYGITEGDSTANAEVDDDYVEKQTVLFEYDGEKYWMDTEETSNGIHDIYSYDSLEHIGYYDKSKNTIMQIDE